MGAWVIQNSRKRVEGGGALRCEPQFCRARITRGGGGIFVLVLFYYSAATGRNSLPWITWARVPSI